MAELQPGDRVRHSRLVLFGEGTVMKDQPDLEHGIVYVEWDELPEIGTALGLVLNGTERASWTIGLGKDVLVKLSDGDSDRADLEA